MKTVKSSRVTPLLRFIEHDHRPVMVVSVICGFPLDRPKELMADVELWPIMGDALAVDGGVVDEGLPKVRSEVLVTGDCHVIGDPVPVSTVRVKVGSVDKRVAVIGDRFWKFGGPSDPVPFSVMPVDWAHAFGGEGFERNPRGKGVKPIEVDGKKVHPLPNLEDPKKLIRSEGDKPEPVSFGVIDLSWPQRFSKVGHYDAKWLETRAFGFAADMDPTIFNLAPADQWLEGAFTGDESFTIEHMHPERARIEGTLPPLVVRAFAQLRADAAGAPLREIAMRLDTLRLFPGLMLGVLVFRGTVAVAEEDGSDVLELLFACEDRSAPRPLAHYEEALAKRRVPEKAGLLALSERDLTPPPELGWPKRSMLTDTPHIGLDEGLLVGNLRRREDLEWEAARQRVLDNGGDPADFGFDKRPARPAAAPTDDADAMAEHFEELQKQADEAQKDIAAGTAEIDRQARAAFEAQGQDIDVAIAKAKRDGAGPPKWRAKAQLEELRSLLKIARDNGQPIVEFEEQASDPKYAALLVKSEQKLVASYRGRAHLGEAVAPVGSAESQFGRVELELALHNEIALEAYDFSGFDLTGVVLPGIDLKGGFLEGTNLTDADLSRAKLSDAVLAHATLKNTKLAGADLTSANLGSAIFDGADLSGAILDRTILQGARIARTKFHGARFDRATLLETRFESEVDLRGIQGKDMIFVKLDLRGVGFAEAKLTPCIMVECDLRGVDFERADMSRTTFLGCDLDGARFGGACLAGCQFVQKTSLRGADLRGAELKSASLRGCDLSRARLEGATLDGADLSGALLEEAVLDGVRARNALFMRTRFVRTLMRHADLLGAILMKADLRTADISHTSLFGADLALVLVDGTTLVEGTNMTRARQHPRARPPRDGGAEER